VWEPGAGLGPGNGPFGTTIFGLQASNEGAAALSSCQALFGGPGTGGPGTGESWLRLASWSLVMLPPTSHQEQRTNDQSQGSGGCRIDGRHRSVWRK
jgi:hypothetical protein